MPWIHMLDADRKPTAEVHINLGSKRNREFKYCAFCLREKLLQHGSRLCDGKWASGQTCDAPMCAHHATHVKGEDLDFCPLHRSQAPQTLFDEIDPPSQCPRCEGTGKYSRLPGQEKDCAVCHGTGQITEERV